MKQAAVLLLFLVAALASANSHPANIPIARAKIQPDGSFTLNLQFDILAFILDEEPTVVLDPPMNALLDGTEADLQGRLDEAHRRFESGLRFCGAEFAQAVRSATWPSARDIQEMGRQAKSPRLPLMWSIDLRGQLPSGAKESQFAFPNVMGTVVLTTEFPYTEPISEPVEPGQTSAGQHIPTTAEVDRLKAGFVHIDRTEPSTSELSESRTKNELQQRYNAWSKAYMAHDIEVLLDVLAPGYTLKTASGTTISRAEYEVMLRSRKKQAEDTSSYRTEILRLTLKEGVAAVYSRETTNNPRRDEKSGKLVPNVWEHEYIDVWVQQSGKWRLRSTNTVREAPIKVGNLPSWR